MSIPGKITHERLEQSLLLSKLPAWRARLDGWVSQELGRLDVEGPRERDPTAKRTAALQEKKTKYVKIKLKLQVDDP